MPSPSARSSTESEPLSGSAIADGRSCTSSPTYVARQSQAILAHPFVVESAIGTLCKLRVVFRRERCTVARFTGAAFDASRAPRPEVSVNFAWAVEMWMCKALRCSCTVAIHALHVAPDIPSPVRTWRAAESWFACFCLSHARVCSATHLQRLGVVSSSAAKAGRCRRRARASWRTLRSVCVRRRVWMSVAKTAPLATVSRHLKRY